TPEELFRRETLEASAGLVGSTAGRRPNRTGPLPPSGPFPALVRLRLAGGAGWGQHRQRLHPQADAVPRSSRRVQPASGLVPLPVALPALVAPAAAADPAIHLNQLGFLPGAGKIAVVEGVDGGRF